LKALGLIAVTALALTGCMPLKQQTTVSGSPDVHTLLCDDQYLLIQIGAANVPNDHKIIATESYVAPPRGTRYSVQIEPHPFDGEQKVPYVRDRVYPVDSSGHRLRRWPNGVWSIHLTVETAGTRSTIDQQIKFWTFFYNPLFHGPPN
jgi:hypothetical protein